MLVVPVTALLASYATPTPGSGKTTLLHLTTGLEQPTSGAIAIARQDLGDLADRKSRSARLRGGHRLQHFVLLDALSAVENVTTGLRIRAAPAIRPDG